MKIFFGLSLLALAAIWGCDPVRRIDMKNETADTVKFIWTLNEDSLMNNPFLLSNSKKLEFVLYPPKVKSIKMSFGPGSWTPKDVQKLVGFLESFQIQSASQRIRIDSLSTLKDFLLARRRGVGGARIEIAVKDLAQIKNKAVQ